LTARCFFKECAPAAHTWALTVLLGLLVLQAQLIATANTPLPSYERVRLFQTARTISDPELTDQDGRPFQLSQLHGQVALVFFGFTNCPDICPVTMAKFQQLQRSGNVDPEKVAFVFISVDTERDTPAVVKAYLDKFSPRFIGLTGDSDKIKTIAKDFSASFFKDNPSGSSGDYSVAHSPQAFVLDPAGRLRAEFYSPSVEAMAGIALALLSEANNATSDEAN
jgi:protein SCO1/2